MVAPGLTISQYAYNLRQIGQAYNQFPPYYFYNPYITRTTVLPPTINYPYYYNPYLYGVYSPYALSYYYNPYLLGY
jgi:hypothetical protein